MTGIEGLLCASTQTGICGFGSGIVKAPIDIVDGDWVFVALSIYSSVLRVIIINTYFNTIVKSSMTACVRYADNDTILMLTNTHLYANGNGMRTESGANILAYGIESEANKGVGLLLRSNDSIIQGTFYANKTYGIQIGDDNSFSGANNLNMQLHNNKVAQLKWGGSAGYNMVNAVVFPNDPSQQFFENKPSNSDYIATSGPNAVQQFPGGILMDSDRNMYGVKESTK
jgi:hypothetical protein